MDIRVDNTDRLFELYCEYMERLKSDVRSANHRMGASKPSDFTLVSLSRREFDQIIEPPTRDPLNRCRWLRSIVRGHEAEFPEMLTAIDEFVSRHEDVTLRLQNSAA